MAITVTDNRTLIDAGDAVTGWSSPVGGNAPTSYTVDPTPKELSAHNGVVVSNAESELLFTLGASVDLSAGVLFYIWALPQGIMDSTANYGMAAVVGDGTNTNAYQIGGKDAAVFRHDSGSAVNYQCICIDTGSFPATGKALRGTFGSLTLTALTEFGVDFTTTLKSVGGVENCFVDKALYGNGGLTITGTDTGAYFLEDLAALDEASTSGGSYGGCRRLGGGIYGVQIKLLLGDTGTGSDTLSIVDQTLKIENFSGVGTDKFGITIQGNATGTQTIAFTGSVLFCPAGTGAFITATDVNIDSFDVTGCFIQNFDQGISLSADATNAPNHDISDNTFIGCSQINIGKTAFKDNTINSTTDANGGMIIDSNTSLTNVSGLSFVSDGTGHAIYITATGTYTFTSFTYSGYGAGGTTDATIYNNSGGLVTIDVSGGDTPTVRNGASASTVVNNTVTLSVEVQDKNGTAIEDALVYAQLVTPDEYTSTASDNAQGDTTFVVQEAIDSNNAPSSGWIMVYDASTSGEHSYRYASWSTSTFTLESKIGPTACTGGGSSTSLQDTVTDFTAINIVEGDTVRNETDGSWAIVEEIVDADNITTTALQGGTDDTWTSGDNYSFHSLAVAYNASDTARVPLINSLTNASGIASANHNYGSDKDITVRVRKSSTGATRYFNVSSPGTIISTGYTTTLVMGEDNIAT